jgi:hypothetical protein
LVSLKNIITHILQAHDFEVYEKDNIVYGEKDGDSVSIGLYDDISVAELRKHSKAVSENASRHIICVLSAGQSVEEESSKLGLAIWKKADIEKEMGCAIKTHIESVPGSLLTELVNPPDGSSQNPSITVESLGTEGQPQIFKSVLTAEDVAEISKKTIQGFKQELELVPHYLFDYSCSFEGKDGQTVKREGVVSINALTGKYSSWNNEPETDPKAAHLVQLEPKIDGENARKIAIHAVTQLNTEFKEIITERDHATIIEKATFRPEPSAINLDSQRMVMMPVWCVEGKHGVMILDGISGKIISEDYYEKK